MLKIAVSIIILAAAVVFLLPFLVKISVYAKRKFAKEIEEDLS